MHPVNRSYSSIKTQKEVKKSFFTKFGVKFWIAFSPKFATFSPKFATLTPNLYTLGNLVKVALYLSSKTNYYELKSDNCRIYDLIPGSRAKLKSAESNFNR